jgi:superfamily II DNA or RNA helicase
MDQGVPIIGFTGTHLTDTQVQIWKSGGFTALEPAVDPDWMPFTPTAFEPIYDRFVAFVDDLYSADIGRYYAMLDERHGDLGFGEIKRLARNGDDLAIGLLREMTGRLKLFESSGTAHSKYRAVVQAAKQPGPTLVLTRYIHSAEAIAALLSRSGVETNIVHGEMSRLDIEAGTSWFRGRAENDVCALVLTRDLGGRGLDFSRAARVILISPRSNHQTVAQELARIRSRASNPKRALVFYYAHTEEEIKAYRLATALHRDRYGGQRLFDVSFGSAGTRLTSFESRNLRNEESLPLDHEELSSP